jgi:alkanesulfonate monooxygenase SsuD/methylene tetrahydromethanopterin reductase-like flavin-dependent oxidoreductase (luciferase family)
MDFGVFDHIDTDGQNLRDFYASRLRIVEHCERAGFYAYHIAEHHGTPLGLAPSPGLFLSAAFQRTTKMRLGPLVFILPLYDPLRLIEEIAMLDQMSGGRLELGIGRGTSPLEAALFNSDHQQSAPRYAEALEVILKGLTHKTLDYEGQFYRYTNVPIELSPLQLPHPPLWIGGHSVDGAARAAKLGANYVTQDTAEGTRPYMDSYRATWKEASPGKPLPKLGLLRFILVADSDAEAERLARRAYPKWHAAYDHLHRKHGLVHERGARTADFGVTFDENVRGVYGGPAKVARELRQQAETAGINYCVGQFSFGDLSETEVARSIALFGSEVMPALRGL